MKLAALVQFKNQRDLHLGWNLCGRKAGCRFHCYSGYAGWGPEQLEREIQEGAWLVAAVDPQLILDSPTEELWNRGMDSMGIDPAALAAGGGAEA